MVQVVRTSSFFLTLFLFAQSGAAMAEGIPVTAQPLSAITVDDTQSAPGEVVPANRTELASQLAARIEEVKVDVGMQVAQGDLLVLLANREFKLAVAQSEANIVSIQAQIEQAQAQLKRAESLIDKAFMSREAVQTRATALAVLQANLQVETVARSVANMNLARASIRAPFDGEVVARQAQLGGYARQGDVLLTLAQSGNSEIAVPVFPGAVAGLADAQPMFESYGQKYALSVARVSSVIDPATQLQNVRFTFVDDAAPVGAAGMVRWRSGTGLIPARLVERRNGQLGVFLARSGQAVFHPLAGALEGRAAGHTLPSNTLLVVDGRTRLQDGDPIALRAP